MRFSVPLYTKMIKNLYGGICRTNLQLVCSLRHVSLPQKLPDFSVTMAVLALETPFRDIDTEKMACFCVTMRAAQQNYVFDIPTCNYSSLPSRSSASENVLTVIGGYCALCLLMSSAYRTGHNLLPVQ